ncbi:MAG: YggS family pyridoxal phosphate-dependent enzyme [Candidatus Marinimicrobia bacterium]|nr:YggS family pyridoxal phosphate-dependent enzyme [Candidatus Neomarinimicrobiota bacterium]
MIADRLSRVIENIEDAKRRSGSNKTIDIVAVSKTQPYSKIIEIYNLGIRSIGENRIQEAEKKFEQLPGLPKLKKRMIGHLQSNKINRALSLFNAVDSIDSVKLAAKIAQKSASDGFPVLLEVNTSGELTKYGFSPHHTEELMKCCEMEGMVVSGLMTVGPLSDNESDLRKSFARLRRLLESLNRELPDERKLTVLSMGMSNDYQIAIEEGSTMLRLGTALFGPRIIG